MLFFVLRLYSVQLQRTTSQLAEDVRAIRQCVISNIAVTEDGNDGRGDAATSTSVVVQTPPADRVRELRRSIRKFALAASAASDPSVLSQGCGTLLLYVGKLLEHPDVPRYRRLSVANASFKALVAPIAGHEGVLGAVGFARRGAYFEWTWVSTPASASSVVDGNKSPSAKGMSSLDSSRQDKDCPDEATRTILLKLCVALLEKAKVGEVINEEVENETAECQDRKEGKCNTTMGGLLSTLNIVDSKGDDEDGTGTGTALGLGFQEVRLSVDHFFTLLLLFF